MTERIDHAKLAQVIRYNIHAEEMADTTTANWLATAQVHATLALVEQQRIANLVAILDLSESGQESLEQQGVDLFDVSAHVKVGLGL